MKLKIQPQGLLERIALWFNLAPTPLVDTQVAFNAARAIMAAADVGIYEALERLQKRRNKFPVQFIQIKRQQRTCWIVLSALVICGGMKGPIR